MRRIAVLLGALLSLLATPAAARTTRLTITETGEGVRIVYDLPAPVTALALGGTAGRSPNRSVRLAEPGLAWRGGRIVGTAPFRRATLLIVPDDREEDARYSLLTAVEGRGFVLFAPYLLPSAGSFEARVSLGGGRYRALPRDEARGSNILVGAVPVAAGRMSLLSATNMPPALAASLRGRTAALLDFYTHRLRRRLGFRPLIVMTYAERAPRPELAGFRGDVTANGVILLRFRGAAPDPGEDAARGRVTGFLAHELFHLWNGRSDDHPANEAWLHEGSAEYYSWLAVAALWPGEISLERNLQNALNGCMAFLGPRALLALEAEQAGLRYPCGAIAQWLADAGTRGASGGRRTGFDLWARLLRGGPGERGYTLAGFRAAADALAPGTALLLGRFLESGLGWEALAPALAAQGADVAAGPPAPQGLHFAAARAIALSLCTGFSGAGSGGGGVYFTGECGALGGQVVIHRVDGLDPLAAAETVYRRVREACATRAELALVLRAGAETHERTLRCTIAFEPALPDIRIRRALPLSPPERSSP
ncbi:MAG TPA: hypothetical protein VEX35_05435 [Allosphingosinicella sp.]|nr:hypothetical protein [Allosphingosinicella sp.]